MSDNTKDFGLFIDGIRLDRNMSREDLIDGIVSLSQYKRYLRGAAPIPNTVLILIADRLKISISDLHIIYQSKQDTQYNKIQDIYKHIRNYEYEVANKEARKMLNEQFISSTNKLFFDFCFINIQYNLNLISDVHVLDKYSQLIDYPKCTKNETFTWIELNILMQIARISSKIENYEPSNLIYDMLTDSNFKYVHSEDKSIIPVHFTSLAAILGRQGKFEEVIILTDEAINHCKKYQISTALSTLFLTKAFALRDLERNDEAIIEADKALMQLYIEDKKEKYYQCKSLLEERTSHQFMDLYIK